MIPSFHIQQGDVIAGLRELPSESVHCCVTSPPYWGLRDYGIEPSVWGGGPSCGHVHVWRKASGVLTNDCYCGAWRGCLGLEPDPDLYIAHMVEVFRHVRRVLHRSGSLWLNLGDCYCTNPHGNGPSFDPKYAGGRERNGDTRANRTNTPESIGLKNKDLAMLPARVALALQADGWYLRSQIPWLKRNGMPESTPDRPTSMVEYIFLFSKSEEYYYDREAVRIAASGNSHSRGGGVNPKAMGPNSRMNRDQDPSHQTEAKIRAKQNRSFSAAVTSVVSTRARRNSDWFFESWHGLLPDENGDPLAFIVNPQPFSIELCSACKTCYEQREFRKLVKDEKTKQRICTCGAQSWTSHFATFPERLVEPMILAGTSERGCCALCGASWERILEKPRVGDLHPNQEKKAAGVNGNWPKHASGDGQSAIARMNGNVKRARSLAEGEHDQPFSAPVTLGWKATCEHPLFPAGEPVPCTVLDPFAGSGRTGLMAVKLGRNFQGMELNPDYRRIAYWSAEKRFGVTEVSEAVASRSPGTRKTSSGGSSCLSIVGTGSAFSAGSANWSEVL